MKNNGDSPGFLGIKFKSPQSKRKEEKVSYRGQYQKTWLDIC